MASNPAFRRLIRRPKEHEPGEAARAAAVRELLEESGHWARIIRWIEDAPAKSEPNAPIVTLPARVPALCVSSVGVSDRTAASSQHASRRHSTRRGIAVAVRLGWGNLLDPSVRGPDAHAGREQGQRVRLGW